MPFNNSSIFLALLRSSFTSLITRYSNKTRFRLSIGNRLTAEIMEAILYALFIGISSSLSLSSTACNDIAKLTPNSICPNLSILELNPLVETVCRFGEIAKPFSSEKIRIASVRWSRLSSGSPIPIYTILPRRLCSMLLSLLMTSTWATISPAVKFRTNPPLAVKQKLHPTLHPTCVETHTVYLAWWRSSPFSSKIGSFIFNNTVSIVLPSCSSKRYLIVPSILTSFCRIFRGFKTKFSFSVSLRELGIFFISL